jgi:hypothetical protein
MINLKTSLLAALAATAAVVGVSYSASAQDTQRGNAPKCEVVIDRSQAVGAYDLTRQVSESGDCTCYVYTGPSSQPAAIENNIAALQRSKTCSNAKQMNVPDGAGVGAGVANKSTGILLGLLAAGTVGVGVAIAAGGNGATTPVSP